MENYFSSKLELKKTKKTKKEESEEEKNPVSKNGLKWIGVELRIHSAKRENAVLTCCCTE